MQLFGTLVGFHKLDSLILFFHCFDKKTKALQNFLKTSIFANVLRTYTFKRSPIFLLLCTFSIVFALHHGGTIPSSIYAISIFFGFSQSNPLILAGHYMFF